MGSEVKAATSYDEQLELLRQRGLVILNTPKAKEILSYLNYYTFTGYLHGFKVDAYQYQVGISFERITRIIEFDRRFRSILMYAVEMIEHALKTKVTYNYAHCYGPLGYLEVDNFRSATEHRYFIKSSKILSTKIRCCHLLGITYTTMKENCRYGWQ
jgi:abortive infection bacteriophage resistance protein